MGNLPDLIFWGVLVAASCLVILRLKGEDKNARSVVRLGFGFMILGSLLEMMRDVFKFSYRANWTVQMFASLFVGISVGMYVSKLIYAGWKEEPLCNWKPRWKERL